MAARATSSEDATFVVELTPAGRGAVAVVVADGPNSLSAVEQHFIANSKRPLRSTRLQRNVVGRWGGSAGEELVVARRSDQQIEVHCHGGVAAVRKIIADLAAAGCQEVSWRDWLVSRRSHWNVRPKQSVDDAVTRSAQIALADAITTRTAAVLLDQLNGTLSKAIHTAIDLVSRGEWEEAGMLIDDLLFHREFGLHLTTPWRVVLAGPPNVGKSSLINALAGFQRAIVSPTPGTTRDVVTLTTAIDGWPVELADTAGLRNTTDEIESAGVRLAEEMLAAADVVLLVHDASQSEALDSQSESVAACGSLRTRRLVPAPSPFGSGQGEGALVSGASPSPQPSPKGRGRIPKHAPREHRLVIDVWNKIDLQPASILQTSLATKTSHAAAGEIVRTSALTGVGIDDLMKAISHALVPSVPPARTPIPFTALQIESLAVAQNAIRRQHAASANEALQSLLAFSWRFPLD